MSTLDEILAHYGVPGMKWGKRKASSSSGASKGEKNPPASEDALRAKAAKVKAKKSVDSLSNKELQELVQRLNLEQQYNRLSPKNAGKAFVSKLLLDTGQRAASKALSNQIDNLIKVK